MKRLNVILLFTVWWFHTPIFCCLNNLYLNEPTQFINFIKVQKKKKKHYYFKQSKASNRKPSSPIVPLKQPNKHASKTHHLSPTFL